MLNAEWNQPKDREVYLHRHPAFVSQDTMRYNPNRTNQLASLVGLKMLYMIAAGSVQSH